MSRFELLLDARKALSRTVDLDDILAELFRENQDLHSFKVEVTTEFDDSNYSDYARVTMVNGRHVDCEGSYEDEEEENPLPVASQETINRAMNLAGEVRDKHSHGDYLIERSDYESDGPRQVTGIKEMICASALLGGEKIPVSVLSGCHTRWAIHHAEVHGRFSEEDEFALFTGEDKMPAALKYAEKFGPLSDNTLNYFLLTLKSDDYGYEDLQKYLELRAA
jgi:hypothetical protein